MKCMRDSNFIILSQQRAGSELLVTLLDSHPQVRCSSELWHAVGSGSQLEFFNKYFSQGHAGLALGTKLMANQLSSDFVKLLDNESLAPKVILLRRDYIETCISDWINNKKKITGRAAHSSQPEEIIKFTIPPLEFKAGLERVIYEDKSLCGLYNSFREGPEDPESWFIVDYSDISSDNSNRRRTMQDIYSFLEVDSEHEATTPLVKQNPRDVSDYVNNFCDLLKLAEDLGINYKKGIPLYD